MLCCTGRSKTADALHSACVHRVSTQDRAARKFAIRLGIVEDFESRFTAMRSAPAPFDVAEAGPRTAVRTTVSPAAVAAVR
ncbi:MAG: hypothetical protein ACM3L9_07680 [Deltaproteobacteria bacterium]